MKDERKNLWMWQIKDGNDLSFSDNIEYDSLDQAQEALLFHWSYIWWPKEGACSRKINKDHAQFVFFQAGKWSEPTEMVSIDLQFKQLMTICLILAIIGIIGDWIILGCLPTRSILTFAIIFIVSFLAFWAKYKKGIY